MFTDADRKVLEQVAATSKANGSAIATLTRKCLGWYTHLMFGRPVPGGADSPGHAGLTELRDQIADLTTGGATVDYDRLADMVADKIAKRMQS